MSSGFGQTQIPPSVADTSSSHPFVPFTLPTRKPSHVQNIVKPRLPYLHPCPSRYHLPAISVAEPNNNNTGASVQLIGTHPSHVLERAHRHTPIVEHSPRVVPADRFREVISRVSKDRVTWTTDRGRSCLLWDKMHSGRSTGASVIAPVSPWSCRCLCWVLVNTKPIRGRVWHLACPSWVDHRSPLHNAWPRLLLLMLDPVFKKRHEGEILPMEVVSVVAQLT